MSFESAIVSTVGTDIARLQPLLDHYGLWALCVACLVEGFGIPLPGQTLLIACALMAGSGTFALGDVLLVAWLATQLGDVMGYLIGRLALQRVLARRVSRGERLARLERGFDRWGPALLMVARFLDGIRQTSNLAAGMLRMPWWHFLLATAIGTSLWVGLLGAGPFYLERDVHQIAAALASLKPWLILLTLAALAGAGIYLFGRTQRPRD